MRVHIFEILAIFCMVRSVKIPRLNFAFHVQLDEIVIEMLHWKKSKSTLSKPVTSTFKGCSNSSSKCEIYLTSKRLPNPLRGFKLSNGVFTAWICYEAPQFERSKAVHPYKKYWKSVYNRCASLIYTIWL